MGFKGKRFHDPIDYLFVVVENFCFLFLKRRGFPGISGIPGILFHQHMAGTAVGGDGTCHGNAFFLVGGLNPEGRFPGDMEKGLIPFFPGGDSESGNRGDGPVIEGQ